jgi:hypothetical protein
LFPLVLINDVPLLLVTGYALGGDTEPVTVYLDDLRRAGRLRAAPLRPHGSARSIARALHEIYRRAYGSDPTAAVTDWVSSQLEHVEGLAIDPRSPSRAVS